MEVKFIETTDTIEVIFDTDDMVTTTIEELEDELDGVGVSLFKEDLENLFNDAVRYGKASMKLSDDKSHNITNNGITSTDNMEATEQEEEYSLYDAEKIANTVGVWLTTVLAGGYRIEKAQVSRGYTLEEIEYSGNIRMNRQHICGPKIKILEMICDEITPISSGCAARRIISQESMTEGNYLYSRMVLEEDIVVHYRLKKQENSGNHSFLKI